MSKITEELEKKYFPRDNFTNLKDMLFNAMSKYPSNIAFELKDSNGSIKKVTYLEYVEDVISLGTELINMGFLGKKIAVIGKNSYNWSISYMAASIIGIVVPIDKELHSNDIINFLNIAEVSAILGDNKNLQEILKDASNISNKNLLFIDFNNTQEFMNYKNIESIKSAGKKSLDSGNTAFKEIIINPDEMHFLLFTSGTTGNAKGVCLSHRNICSNIISVGKIVKVDKNTRILSILPMHHTYECTLGHLLVLASGGTIFFCEGLRHILNNLEEFSPTILLSVPLLLENFHNKIMKKLEASLPKRYFKNPDVHVMDKLPFFMKWIVKNKISKIFGGNLKTIIVGAAAMNPAIIDSFSKFGIKILQGYGLTECSPLVAGNNDFFQKSDSAGLPIPDTTFKIDNPNSDGIGEIIVSGPNVMLGYYKDNYRTKEVLKDGWFYTGDLGRIDEDGYLYITGRVKNVIVTKNGKKVYPEELEYCLADNPYISECLVLGRTNEQNNETYVNAQIFPDFDLLKKDKGITSAEDIKKFISEIIKNINSKLPNYKHIKEFTIKDTEFEKTTTQKIKRFGKNIK